ncbi:MAG: hypothetical protein H6576_14555 [Lewinellaceae bacterium]|nr:hypothetical protein [Saprospiraceae bacterium]MCB9344923.1 hypothetical protein [Lewinellaceae bacterium]
MKKSLKFFFLPFLAIIAIFVACNKESAATVEDAVDEVLFSVQERGGMGRFGCYELVFPVSFTLPDGTEVTVDSYDEMKAAIRDYFQNNGTPHQHDHIRPKIDFVFPISVINEDGEIITVNDQAGLKDLREDCAGTFGNHDHHGHGQHGLSCFTIVFPITIEFPDGSTAEANDRMELHQLIRVWHHNNPGVDQRPKFVFPITVKMTDDDSLVTLNSADELRALKESCE